MMNWKVANMERVGDDENAKKNRDICVSYMVNDNLAKNVVKF